MAGDGIVVAVDVALLPPDDFRAQLVAINSQLAAPPVGFRFDETHHPHLTLAQLFVRHSGIAPLTKAIEDTLRDVPPVRLTPTNVSVGGTASVLGVTRTALLSDLHRRLMDAVLPFEAGGGDLSAFDIDGPSARESDRTWVQRFRHHAAYGQFTPHWTLGVGPVTVPVEGGRVVSRDVSLFRLGRFCTCRRALAAWTLTAPSR